MATDQTAGVPPSLGITILVNIGWTPNSRNAESAIVTAKTGRARRADPTEITGRDG